MFVQGRLTASAVGQIVGLQSEEIKQIASEYAEKVSSCRRPRLPKRKRSSSVILTDDSHQQTLTKEAKILCFLLKISSTLRISDSDQKKDDHLNHLGSTF